MQTLLALISFFGGDMIHANVWLTDTERRFPFPCNDKRVTTSKDISTVKIYRLSKIYEALNNLRLLRDRLNLCHLPNSGITHQGWSKAQKITWKTDNEQMPMWTWAGYKTKKQNSDFQRQSTSIFIPEQSPAVTGPTAVYPDCAVYHARAHMPGNNTGLHRTGRTQLQLLFEPFSINGCLEGLMALHVFMDPNKEREQRQGVCYYLHQSNWRPLSW